MIKGNVKLSDIYKRQIISPFDFLFEKLDIIEINRHNPDVD